MASVVGNVTLQVGMNVDDVQKNTATATESIRKMESSIGRSIQRIQSRQVGQALTGVIKNFVGPTAAFSVGAELGTELIRGLSQGTIRSVRDFGRVAADAIGKTIASIPIAGEVYKLGEAFGNWAWGVDAANKSLKESEETIARISRVTGAMFKQKDMIEGDLAGTQKQVDQLGMSDFDRMRDDALRFANSLQSVEGQSVDRVRAAYLEQKNLLIDQLEVADEMTRRFNEQVDALKEQEEIRDRMATAEAKQREEQRKREDESARAFSDARDRAQELAAKGQQQLSEHRADALGRVFGMGTESVSTAAGSMRVAGTITDPIKVAEDSLEVERQQLETLKQIAESFTSKDSASEGWDA